MTEMRQLPDTSAELNDVLDNLARYMWLNDGGAIVIDSRLPKLIGIENEGKLNACVADNILCERGTGDFINYAGAVRDFRKMIVM